MPTPLQSATESLGELLICGFKGLELSDETSAFLSQAGVGGVVLSEDNYDSPAQLAELSNSIQACRPKGRLPLWVAADQEGGRAQQFKKHFTRIPTAQAIAATDSPKLAFELAEMMAKELKAVGINLNFAPVTDIATNARNPVVGPLAFGNDEETVSKMTSGMVRGHLVQGVQPCAKHFPGQGDTGTDSQFALPRTENSLDQMKERELKPFIKAFRSRCSIVMTAHILCAQLDPKLPATLSPRILRELLRTELRYSRVIISDEMDKKGIADHFSPEEAARLALQAGCDLLLYPTEAGARHAYASLTQDLDSGRLAPEIVLEACARVRALKKDALLPYQDADIAGVGKSVGLPEHAELVAKVAEPLKK